MGIVVSPVFVVAYALVLRLLPGHLGVWARARWALLIALGIFVLALGGGWLVLLDGREVIRAW